MTAAELLDYRPCGYPMHVADYWRNRRFIPFYSGWPGNEIYVYLGLEKLMKRISNTLTPEVTPNVIRRNFTETNFDLGQRKTFFWLEDSGLATVVVIAFSLEGVPSGRHGKSKNDFTGAKGSQMPV